MLAFQIGFEIMSLVRTSSNMVPTFLILEIYNLYNSWSAKHLLSQVSGYRNLSSYRLNCIKSRCFQVESWKDTWRILKSSKKNVNPHGFAVVQSNQQLWRKGGNVWKCTSLLDCFQEVVKTEQNKSKSLRISPCERQDWGSGSIRPSHWLKLISNADVHVFAASANRGTVFKYLRTTRPA